VLYGCDILAREKEERRLIINFEVLTAVGTEVTFAVGFCDTSVPIYQNIRRNILGNSDLGRLSDFENEERKIFASKIEDRKRVC
jgi:hypothetical protein